MSGTRVFEPRRSHRLRYARAEFTDMWRAPRGLQRMPIIGRSCASERFSPVATASLGGWLSKAGPCMSRTLRVAGINDAGSVELIPDRPLVHPGPVRGEQSSSRSPRRGVSFGILKDLVREVGAHRVAMGTCGLGPEPASGSAFRAAVSDWQRPEEPFGGAGPMVRIRLPPAVTPCRGTPGGAGSA